MILLKNRPIKDLLQILLDNIDKMSNGLCGLSCTLLCGEIITTSEYRLLLKYINDNKPELKNRNRYWWGFVYNWKPGSVKPRIAWLKKHIKINN